MSNSTPQFPLVRASHGCVIPPHRSHSTEFAMSVPLEFCRRNTIFRVESGPANCSEQTMSTCGPSRSRPAIRAAAKLRGVVDSTSPQRM